MKRGPTFALFIALCLVPAVGAAEEPPEKKEAPKKMSAEEQKALERKIVAAINAQAGTIDACTARYLKEYPAAKGSVALALEVEREGAVKSAKATTSLTGARNLRPCIEKAGRAVKFPAPNTEKPARLTLSVPVQKGAKFKLYAKGDEPKPKPEDPAAPVTVQFNMRSFTPSW